MSGKTLKTKSGKIVNKSKKTMNKALKRNTELLFEIGTMRHLDRVWRQFLNPDTANCAEHIFRVAWIAMTLAKLEKKGDHGKILKMALVHDLTETRTGDVHYLSRQYTKRSEIQAVEDMFEETVHSDEMIALFKEYEERKCIEAQIVKDADNLDVELELAEMRAKGFSLGHLWVKNRKDNVYPKLFTASAKKLWDNIGKTDPHDWHYYSKMNRHNGGDWKKKG
ncbi:MAG: HD domain-containing protein [Candidatus Paceibacterota bacterium]|jgi:putative hydrolase of HD superfamily